MRLYKYLHPDRIDVLRNGLIRFSSPKVLNDPFELKPIMSSSETKGFLDAELDSEMSKCLEGEYQKLPRTLRRRMTLEQFSEQMKQRILLARKEVGVFADLVVPMVQTAMARKFEEMIGILCLTESPDNLLMWAHYADSHQGFVIELDCEAPFFDQRRSPEDDFRHIKKVSYAEQRPTFSLSDNDDFSPFITKGLDWEYEAEWRMMLPLAEATSVIDSGATDVHLFAYPRAAIKTVILGCRMSDPKRSELLSLLRDAEELRHVHCKQARIDLERYCLRFFPVGE